MNRCRKTVLCLAAIALSCLLMSFTCMASENIGEPINLVCNEKSLEGGLYINETAYAPYRVLVSAIEPDVTYIWANNTSTAYGDGIVISAKANCNYIEANGRVIYCDKGPNLLIDGVLYVPTASIARAYSLNWSWNGERMRSCVAGKPSPILHGDKFYDKDELYWLSHIISAESRGEPFRGQVAVGNVILRRVYDGSFPDSIYGVIFDRRFGIQFTPAYSGTIYKNPSESAVLAAKIALEGTEVVQALYFCASRGASRSWMSRNCETVATIGNHTFFY